MIPSQHFRQVAHDAMIYGGFAALSRASGFILLPVLTRYFSPADYGFIELFAASVACFSLIIRLALPSALIRIYLELPDESSRRRLLGSTLLVVAALGLCAVVGLPLLLAALDAYSVDNGVTSEMVTVGMATAALTALSSLPEATLRLHRQIGRYNAVSLVSTGTFLLLCLWSIWLGQATLMSIFLSQLVGAGLGCCVAIWSVRNRIAIGVNLSLLGRSCRFALPLLPSVLVTWVNDQADRYLLAWLTGLAGVAAYAVAAKIALIFHFATTVFRQAWHPYSMGLINAPERNEVYRSMLEIYAATGAVLGLFFIAVVPELFSWLVPHEFASGVVLVPYLMVVALSHQASVITSLGLVLNERTAYMSGAAVACIVLNLLLSIWFIKLLGIMGAAIGATVSELVLTILLLWRSNHEASIEFSTSRFLSAVAIFLVGAHAILAVSQEPLTGFSFIERSVICLIGTTICYRFCLNRDSRALLFEILFRKVQPQ